VVQCGPGDTSTAAEIVRRFAHRFQTRQWPPDRPLPHVFYDPRSLDLTADKRACLHAKCIVVDGESVFISSANFTEAAQERNIEVGLLVDSR
jgi:phosphatidylserine/phosphatidylglycerophosphate/cardiolipin synthase-like enzyme